MLTIASYGGGVNSTAMLIGAHERGESVDLILFADTGGEKPETYAFVNRFSRWLVSRGMPEIITVRKTTKRQGRYNAPGVSLTLEQHSLQTGTLPAVAYGMKSCSLKFKRDPQNEYVKNWQPAVDAWASGEKLTKLIGYDAGEAHRQAAAPDDSGYLNRYPLIEWGWGREGCEAAITRAGLCVPPKSSCFFCPNMKEWEILELKERHPELLERALQIERNAGPNLIVIKGLARDITWQQIVDYDRRQGNLLPARADAMPCECYDGE